MNAEQIKSAAKAFGADLVGIASIRQLEYLPPEQNPKSIMPNVKSIIVIGRRILRGALRGVEEGTSFGSTYTMFGANWQMNCFLNKSVNDLTREIENCGVEAVPMLPIIFPGEQIQLRPGQAKANVVLDYQLIAQAAGLGSVGKGGFFLTPEYGHRQRFGLILVDYELEADAIDTTDLCHNCQACADGCPLHAIDTTQTIKKGLPGFEKNCFVINQKLCAHCSNGCFGGSCDKFDRYAASCGRACMVALEDKIGNKFVNKFRKRATWARDVRGKVIHS